MHVVTHWHIAPPAPQLPGPNIHLWWIDCTSPREKGAEPCLSTDEHERAVRMADPTRFVCFRTALRRILGRYLAVDPLDLVMGYGRHGKPFLVRPETSLSFNLAHSADRGLLALGEGMDLGVDLERVRPFPRAEAIARRQLGDGVADRLARLPESARTETFFEQWTLMEARAKAGGGGVFAPLDHSYETLAFSPRAGWRAALASSLPLGNPRDWQTFTLDATL